MQVFCLYRDTYGISCANPSLYANINSIIEGHSHYDITHWLWTLYFEVSAVAFWSRHCIGVFFCARSFFIWRKGWNANISKLGYRASNFTRLFYSPKLKHELLIIWLTQQAIILDKMLQKAPPPHTQWRDPVYWYQMAETGLTDNDWLQLSVSGHLWVNATDKVVRVVVIYV